jgi:hypothetical protein
MRIHRIQAKHSAEQQSDEVRQRIVEQVTYSHARLTKLGFAEQADSLAAILQQLEA